MMGTQTAPAQLFYDFDLERHGPSGHMLREIDRVLDVDGMREALRPVPTFAGLVIAATQLTQTGHWWHHPA